MSGAGNYTVQPDVLRDFAETLKSQAMAIQQLDGRLAELSDNSGVINLFGAFSEAASIAQAHMQAMMHVKNLIAQVESLYWFGDEVAVAAADGYQGADQNSADQLSRFRIDPNSVVGELV
jgi:methionine synthase II (cobalamin-independent)